MNSMCMNKYLSEKLARVANQLVGDDCNRAVITHERSSMYLELIVKRQFEMCLVHLAWGFVEKNIYHKPSVTLALVNLEDAMTQHGERSPFTAELMMHNHDIAIDVWNGNYSEWKLDDEQKIFEYMHGFKIEILDSDCYHND